MYPTQYKCKMFLDDERSPITDDWAIVRSSQEAIDHVKAYGMPVEIAFDHDLGGDDTSMVFLWWMVGELLDGNLVIPKEFTFSVHSQNPIGARNIESLMEGILYNFS